VTDVATLVDDLAAEQQALLDVVRGLAATDWFAPTPSWGWDVRDTVAHLADTDEMAVDTALGGPYAINDVVERCASAEDLTYLGVLKGRSRSGADVAQWFASTSAHEIDVLAGLPPDARIPWGLGMRTPSFVTARLMETWAHGLDVRAALGVEAIDTDRLAHVAWLATRALPYAYTVAGREPPTEPLRVELTLPSGASWTSGPDTATNRISGTAGDYCRVFVQRLRFADTNLVIEGPTALGAISVARAYL
jgi:uncharacterized protein (TIGR03084 family)